MQYTDKSPDLTPMAVEPGWIMQSITYSLSRTVFMNFGNEAQERREPIETLKYALDIIEKNTPINLICKKPFLYILLASQKLCPFTKEMVWEKWNAYMRVECKRQ